MTKKLITVLAIVTVAMFGLIACDGGGGNSGTVENGAFKDSNVSGLRFQSGRQVGVTDANGVFSYRISDPVTFSVGDVIIGTTTGKSIVTPIDLVAGGSSDSPQVLNIVRFLMMLDLDGDPTNGITISAGVQTIARRWAQVDFSTSDLATELVTIISDAASIDGVPHVLPDATTAKTHLESTLLCIHAGGYQGTFTGDDNGPFAVVADAKTGLVEGVAFSNNDQSVIFLNGTSSISFDQSVAFISGSASTGATFSGQLIAPDQIEGTWDNTLFSISGSFSGSRVGGDPNAEFRFTGNYTGDDFGFFTADVDSVDNVSGVVYSILDDQQYSLSGSVTGNSLSATASNGAEITGVLDKPSGTLIGSWVNNSTNTNGTYIGSGCKLD